MIEYNIPFENNFKYVKGTIPAIRFKTLFSDPYILLPANSNVQIIPLTLTLRLTGAIVPFTFICYGIQALIANALPASTGAYGSISPIRSGFYQIGTYAHLQTEPNFTIGGTDIVLMTDTDYPAANMNTAQQFCLSYFEIPKF